MARGRTLEEAYSGRDNAFNFMRLCFALLVMVGHAGVIGWGLADDPVPMPIDTGGVAVTGFFALSGFLIARSGRRSHPLRYVWHRVLRIFPGYWVCLMATAFVLAPLLYWYQRDTLSGFLHHPRGPLDYVLNNIWTDQLQGDVSGVTREAPYPNAINGSLWTLKSELTCYILVLALAVTTLLRRARWMVVLLGVAMSGVIVWDTFHEPVVPGPLADLHAIKLPVLGWFTLYFLFVFALAFVLGMIADLYRSVIPLNDWLGWTSLVLVVASVYFSLPLFGPAIIAWVYLLLWAGVRLPKVLKRIGRRNDYSYGVYIYAFPIQQALAIVGVPKLGWTFYLLTSVATVGLVAACSWHLVEKQAMRAKNWTPRRFRKPPVVAAPVAAAEEPVVAAAPLTAVIPAPREPESVAPVLRSTEPAPGVAPV
ncbi:acyltransferase family protein [Dactylosporangium sucinum]|uniref:O-antigen acetylase n=1 Tax=Dactylosporangium sucinum TaxID=1424081 RepID=A0A917TWQ1_9ACTN|nr:acyltransferase [Dactylosporangium sucinum]GGM39250.1 O-antigen acetylase [Dactylosporangium sucinum]